jgi:(R)-2-hydroxyacyl-CoA dehydratese activating ATPase
MRVAGLDIGSRSIELVVLDGGSGSIVESIEVETTHAVREECERLLARAAADRLLVTGYGRGLAETAFDAGSVTEIKAYARGAEAVLPGCRTVIDIGGQDTKAIALDGAGRVVRFEMNDRCAAGAGRFLEIMAKALGSTIESFGEEALRGKDGVQLSSMCAVFAESEVVGLMTRGAAREDIARAVHRSILRRTAGMVRRVSPEGPVLFAGGAARNRCLARLLGEDLSEEVIVPDSPQMIGALGAALLARGSG